MWILEEENVASLIAIVVTVVWALVVILTVSRGDPVPPLVNGVMMTVVGERLGKKIFDRGKEINS